MRRREALKTLAAGAAAVAAGRDAFAAGAPGPAPGRAPGGEGARARVALVATADRTAGVGRALGLLGENPVRGKPVLIKPNFNTADPFPASTHPDTLAALFVHLRAMGAASLAIAERSGPPETADVLRDKGIPELCRRHDVGLVDFETLPEADWVRVRPPGSHWRDGFLVARPIVDAPCVVSTCCLKTHAYGGVFTMSLKLAIGTVHKRCMRELHTSFRSMRKMIAEVNTAWRPALILLDGLRAFTDGGPSSGTLASPGLLVAGTDRVAVDAVGLAILKAVGSNRDVMDRPIFSQEQLARAVELGLGVPGPDRIELVADDDPGRGWAGRLREILDRG